MIDSVINCACNFAHKTYPNRNIIKVKKNGSATSNSGAANCSGSGGSYIDNDTAHLSTLLILKKGRSQRATTNGDILPLDSV